VICDVLSNVAWDWSRTMTVANYETMIDDDDDAVITLLSWAQCFHLMFTC